MKIKQTITRNFGGKIDGFESNKERAFEKKHLAAYLKGHKRFSMGREPETEEPIWYAVKEVWK